MRNQLEQHPHWNAAPDLLAAIESQTWLVWSIEHDAWWGPNHSSYYTDINAAGRYSLEEAIGICQLRSKRPNNQPCEMLVPSPEWIACRSAAIAKARGT